MSLFEEKKMNELGSNDVEYYIFTVLLSIPLISMILDLYKIIGEVDGLLKGTNSRKSKFTFKTPRSFL